MITSRSPWIAVLAGGDARRMEGAIVGGRRVDRPKQFCRFHGTDTLLRHTLRRAERISERKRILAIVRKAHRQWWDGELVDLARENVLVQTENRGTAVAILHALAHVLRRDPDGTLVVLPSDHAAEYEAVLVEAVESAVRICEQDRQHVCLLGITAESIQPGYGWILPRKNGSGYVHEVERFMEKPSATVAAELHDAGALWNSFILVGSVQAILDSIETSQPLVLQRCLEVLLDPTRGETDVEALFRSLPSLDFGRDVLQTAARHLRVLSVPACGWTDLGTPTRVAQWIERSCYHAMPAVTSAPLG